jgi:tetratricopeptide (TPR) repeat protein
LAEPSTNAPSRGRQLFQQHEFEQASACFLADLRANPENGEAILYLGRIAFEEDRLNAAEQQFEHLTKVVPNDSEAFHWLGRVCGVEARNLGAPRGMMAARRAKSALEKAVLLDPNNVEARVDLATFYREAPAIVGGSNRSAFAQASEIATRDPYLGALVQGDLEMADKNFAEAERSYRSAIERKPAQSEGYFRMAVLRQRTRRYDEAFAAFEKMLQLDPGEKRALFQIGKTADLSGQRLERGREALLEYLHCRPFYIMPKLAWAHRRLGNIYLKQGLPESARDQYLAALLLEPHDKESAAALKLLNEAAGK